MSHSTYIHKTHRPTKVTNSHWSLRIKLPEISGKKYKNINLIQKYANHSGMLSFGENINLLVIEYFKNDESHISCRRNVDFFQL